MQKNIYEKKPLSFSDQLQQLKNRNLTVLDDEASHKMINRGLSATLVQHRRKRS